MHVMNSCLFVDCEQGGNRGMVLGRALRSGGRVAPGAGARDETLRVDFDELPERSILLWICDGSVRAASLRDAELDWLVGGQLSPGHLLWTITVTPFGDHHDPADS